MKIQVSKIFARFINETATETGAKFYAEVLEMSETAYKFNVNIWGPDWIDYNPKTGKFKAIRVSYPPEFFAVPIYLTTENLNKAFTRYNVKTAADLKNMIREICEI